MGQMLVGVDGSPGAELALQWTIDAAKLRGAKVKAIHVWMPWAPVELHGLATIDTKALEDAGRAVLDESIDRVEATELDLSVERMLVPGAASTAMLDEAKDAKLVVVGSRGRGGFAGLLLGSVSHQLAAHAPCPVVVVPATWDPTPKRRVVVGVDGSDEARAALTWAVEWARPLGAEVEAVAVFDAAMAWIDVGSDYEERWIDQARSTATTTVEHVVGEVTRDHAGASVHAVVAEGAPARVLVDRARHADLLVVGRRGRGEFAGLVLGSVSQRCIEHSTCPVAVIP
jgi:nucleotide-binding universal stress UspA family protein